MRFCESDRADSGGEGDDAGSRLAPFRSAMLSVGLLLASVAVMGMLNTVAWRGAGVLGVLAAVVAARAACYAVDTDRAGPYPTSRARSRLHPAASLNGAADDVCVGN